jgi:hypothetical protein
LKALPDETEWKHILIESWTFSFSIGFVGCIPVGLDEKLTDEDKIKRLVNIVKLIIVKISKDEDYLTQDKLNRNSVGGRGMSWQGINKQAFLRTAHMTSDLREGRLKTDASSPLGYLNLG